MTMQEPAGMSSIDERIPGAFQITARAMGVAPDDLDKMLKQGHVIIEPIINDPLYPDDIPGRLIEEL